MSSNEHTYPHHRLLVRGALGQLAMDFRAAFSAPWTVLFGASGSGKSTLLRAMAGLADPGLRVEFGRRHVTGAWLEFDGAIGSLRPEARGIAFAPQEIALFPNMDVRGNLAFPARVRAVKPSENAFAEVVSRLRLKKLLDRRPHQLSGGERQRVNVARALLVPEAQMLLLDEPLTGMDRSLRADLLPALRDFAAARKLPVISVTHEVDEALLLDAEVVRIEDGRAIAQGPAGLVLTREREALLQILGR